MPLEAHYRAIVADPPWSFKTWSDKGMGRSSASHYDVMTQGDIERLPAESWAARDCILFLWAIDSMLPQALSVIDAWGFRLKTVAFYWAKTSQDGSKFPIGTGFWTRANPEICLLATRGKPQRQSRAVRKLIVSPRREHSRKPDEAYERIEALCAGPYLELFARFPRSGWDAWGTMEGVGERRWKSDAGPVV